LLVGLIVGIPKFKGTVKPDLVVNVFVVLGAALDLTSNLEAKKAL